MRDLGTKLDNTAPASSGRLGAPEFNAINSELESAVTSVGISLDPAAGPDADLTMLAQAMSRAASGGVFATDGGAANAYVLSKVGNFVVAKALFTSMRVAWYPAHANTGASTLNAFGLGVKPLYGPTGAALVGGEILASQLTEAIYDASLNTGSGGWKLMPWADAANLGGGGGGGGTPVDPRALAKAWLNYNSISHTINASFGISSVTRNGAGDYTITFTDPFANTNYVAAGMVGDTWAAGTAVATFQGAAVSPAGGHQTTTTYRVMILYAGNVSVGSPFDPDQFYLIFYA